MINTTDILLRIKRLRNEKKIKQDGIAKHLGIDRTTYLRKEKGQIPLTAEEFLLIADFLEVPPSAFFITEPSHIPGGDVGTPDKYEMLLIHIYRLLTEEEKRDLLFSLRLILKGVENESARKLLGEIK